MILLVLWLFKRMKKDLDIDILSNIFSGDGEENVKKCVSKVWRLMWALPPQVLHSAAWQVCPNCNLLLLGWSLADLAKFGCISTGVLIHIGYAVISAWADGTRLYKVSIYTDLIIKRISRSWSASQLTSSECYGDQSQCLHSWPDYLPNCTF